MSGNENRVPLEIAEDIASKVMEILLPGCERIEAAGSVRRRKASVSDLDIVCIPRSPQTLFESGSLVTLPGIVNQAVEDYGWKLLQNGPHKKSIDLGIDLGFLKCELYITTPAQWGVMFLLRTGSADFSHWVVTKRKWGGALPSHMEIGDGRVWMNGKPLSTPEERDVFEAIRLKWIEPEERTEVREEMLIY